MHCFADLKEASVGDTSKSTSLAYQYKLTRQQLFTNTHEDLSTNNVLLLFISLQWGQMDINPYPSASFKLRAFPSHLQVQEVICISYITYYILLNTVASSLIPHICLNCCKIPIVMSKEKMIFWNIKSICV